MQNDDGPPDFTPDPSGKVAGRIGYPLGERATEPGKGQSVVMDAREALIVKALKGAHDVLDSLFSRALGDVGDPAAANAATSAAKTYLSVAMTPPKIAAGDAAVDVLEELAQELRAKRDAPSDEDSADEDG